MSTIDTTTTDRRARTRPTRRVGYVANLIVNVASLWIVNHLPDWDWPPFLTPAFTDLLPYINASIVATIAVNVLWMWRDPPWLRHLAQILLNLIAIVVAVATWRIFPFEFSETGPPWEALARVVIGAGLFGLVIATLAEAVRLLRSAD